MNLLCGHSEPFSLTWPRSGSMRNGQASEHPTSGHLTVASGSSSSPGPQSAPLLSTPLASLAGGVQTLERQVGGRGALLPTPTAMDSKESGGSTPSDVTVTDAVVRTKLGTVPNPRHTR